MLPKAFVQYKNDVGPEKQMSFYTHASPNLLTTALSFSVPEVDLVEIFPHATTIWICSR